MTAIACTGEERAERDDRATGVGWSRTYLAARPAKPRIHFSRVAACTAATQIKPRSERTVLAKSVLDRSPGGAAFFSGR